MGVISPTQMFSGETKHVTRLWVDKRKGTSARVVAWEGTPGRWAGRQAGIWHPSNHTRPRKLTAGAARCMRSHSFTQRRWTAGDTRAIFNPPPSRTECTVWIVFTSLPLWALPTLTAASFRASLQQHTFTCSELYASSPSWHEEQTTHTTCVLTSCWV